MGRWDSECRHRAAPLPELQHKPLLHVQVAQPLFLSTWVGFIPSCSCVPQPRVMGWAQLPVPVPGAWGGGLQVTVGEHNPRGTRAVPAL